MRTDAPELARQVCEGMRARTVQLSSGEPEFPTSAVIERLINICNIMAAVGGKFEGHLIKHW